MTLRLSSSIKFAFKSHQIWTHGINQVYNANPLTLLILSSRFLGGRANKEVSHLTKTWDFDAA